MFWIDKSGKETDYRIILMCLVMAVMQPNQRISVLVIFS